MHWTTLISQIQSKGLTQQDIATRLGKSQAWVADISSGRYADLKWIDGNNLIDLHKSLLRHKGKRSTKVIDSNNKKQVLTRKVGSSDTPKGE